MKPCPKCHKDNPFNYTFCHYCGTNLLEPIQPSSNTKITCPKCGSKNIAFIQYCTACGAPLTDQDRQAKLDHLYEYWYCKTDRTLMRETSSKHQFLISRDIDDSLQELVKDNKLREDQISFAKEIAQDVFNYDPDTNFPLLTRTRCPICMQDSLAPVYYQPPQKDAPILPAAIVSPSQYPRSQQRISPTVPSIIVRPETLTPMSMIQNSLSILIQYPQILLATIIIVILDLTLNFAQVNLHDISSLYLLFFQGIIPVEEPPNIMEVLIGIPVALLCEGFFITLLLISFKGKILLSVDSVSSTKTTSIQFIKYFLRIIIAKLIVDTIYAVVFTIYLMLTFLFGQNYPTLLEISFELFFILLFFLTITLLIISVLISVLFSYVNPSIIMADMRPIDSLVMSLTFTRKYFWPTLIIFVLFTYIPSFGFLFFPPIVVNLGVSTIIMRLLESIQIIILAWGFESFKSNLFKPSVGKAIDMRI